MRFRRLRCGQMGENWLAGESRARAAASSSKRNSVVAPAGFILLPQLSWVG
jgi:hypothetical protein